MITSLVCGKLKNRANSFKLVFERLKITNISKVHNSAHKVRDRGPEVSWLGRVSVSVNKEGIKWREQIPLWIIAPSF